MLSIKHDTSPGKIKGEKKKGGEYRSHRQDDMAVGALPRKIHDGQRDLLVLEVDVHDLHGEVGGWGQDPKNGTGRDWGMGSSTI